MKKILGVKSKLLGKTRKKKKEKNSGTSIILPFVKAKNKFVYK